MSIVSSNEQTIRGVLQPVEAFIERSHNEFTDAIHKVLLPSLMNSSYALHSLKEHLTDAIFAFGEQRFRDGVKSVETNESRIILDVEQPRIASTDIGVGNKVVDDIHGVANTKSSDKGEIERLKTELKQATMKLSVNDITVHQLRDDIEKTRSDINDAETKIKSLELEITRLQTENRTLNHDLTKMKSEKPNIVCPVMDEIRKESDAEDDVSCEDNDNAVEDAEDAEEGFGDEIHEEEEDANTEVEDEETDDEEYAEGEELCKGVVPPERNEVDEIPEEEEGVSEEEDADEDETEVEEYEYKGKMYYILDKKSGPVYECLDDESVGEEIGKIVNGIVYIKGPSTNGNRVVWIKA